VIVRQSNPNTHVYASQYPERAGWTLDTLLLGRAVDTLLWLQWAKTKDGSKNRNRPVSVLPIDRDAKRRTRGQQRPGAAPNPSTLQRIREMLPGNPISGSDRDSKVHKLFG
jgi:hypothetical protein